jgi:hypothetical protein
MYLIQHGFQRGTKIDDAVAAGVADGVIWSPGDEAPSALGTGISAFQEIEQAVDPQFYVAGLAGASLKKLDKYDYFTRDLQASDFTPRRIIDIARDALDFQFGLDVTVVLSPTVVVEAAGDRWSQVALSLAQASIEEWAGRGDPRDLLISVAASRSLLANEEEVNALLDDLTTLECAGFYLLVELEGDGSVRTDEQLDRALWMTYSLAELNEFRVWIPYAGLAGYLFRAVGAEAFAAGWWQKLQAWSPGHWTETGGGRQPRPRVFLESLLSNVLLEELGALRTSDRPLYDEVVAGVGPVAATLRTSLPQNMTPTRDELAAQLFAVCHELDSRVTGTLQERGARLVDDLAAVLARHRRIRQSGITLEPRGSSAHIVEWESAMSRFAARLGGEF